MRLRLNWTIAATAVAVFALFHQVLTSLFDLNPKALQLRVESISELANASQPKLSIEITRRGAALVQPTLAVLELSNSGGKPVLAGDFESKIEISAGRAVVAAVNLEEVDPADLKPVVSVVQQRAVVEPLLLNPGDKVRLLVLTEGAAPDFDANARVVGIKRMQVVPLQPQSSDPDRLKAFVIASCLGPFSLLLLMASARKLDSVSGHVKASIISAGMLAVVSSLAPLLQAAALAPAEWRQTARWSAIAFTATLMTFAMVAIFRYAREALRR